MCSDECRKLTSSDECTASHCTWLFNKPTGYEGKCVLRNSTEYNCSDMKRFGQCLNGGNMEMLSGLCEFVGDECVMKCDENKETCISLTDECFW
jgi:hypothetical protein